MFYSPSVWSPSWLRAIFQSDQFDFATTSLSQTSLCCQCFKLSPSEVLFHISSTQSHSSLPLQHQCLDSFREHSCTAHGITSLLNMGYDHQTLFTFFNLSMVHMHAYICAYRLCYYLIISTIKPPLDWKVVGLFSKGEWFYLCDLVAM